MVTRIGTVYPCGSSKGKSKDISAETFDYNYKDKVIILSYNR